jgi:outer membrane biosynthesis protein TonB
MFDQIIALFERLVIAHEKLAASQEAILRVTDVRVVEDPAPATEPEKPKTTRAKKEKAQEPVEAPKAEEPKKEEPKPEPVKLTLADVKAAVAGYAEARMKGGSADPKGDARQLMAHHGGGAKKTDEIAEEYWADVVGACKSGWEPLPAKDEEL